MKLYRVRAGQYVPIEEVVAGDIAAVQGLIHSYSGDTLID